MMRTPAASAALVTLLGVLLACGADENGAPRSSGYVEATEIRVAAKVPGRAEQVAVTEGARVAAGDTLVQLETTDVDLALRRAHADREQAAAQLRLLQAGARPEEVEQARAQAAAARAERAAADRELQAARDDLARFEQLVARNAGATKPRDDAQARVAVAEARVQAAADRVRAAEAAVARLEAGARSQEIDAARARVAAADAQIATLEQTRRDATILAPAAGIVTSRLVEPGELVAAGTPVAVIIDLDHAWVDAYVEEPMVPSIALDEAATVVTDAGDRMAGRVAFIAPRAEFTPRNVQTADERARLVYRVKVSVDNSAGVLKPGMPVEVEWQP